MSMSSRPGLSPSPAGRLKGTTILSPSVLHGKICSVARMSSVPYQWNADERKDEFAGFDSVFVSAKLLEESCRVVEICLHASFAELPFSILALNAVCLFHPEAQVFFSMHGSFFFFLPRKPRLVLAGSCIDSGAVPLSGTLVQCGLSSPVYGDGLVR
jgi:hypothetical protein